MSETLTVGVHHIGLTTSKLEETARFFTGFLGWKEVKRDKNYPSVFVSDGKMMVTLWAAKEKPAAAFNRKTNVGLHHLALQVKDEAALDEIHKKLKMSGTKTEFAPELLGKGPAKHMMCCEPGGIRIEFIWP